MRNFKKWLISIVAVFIISPAFADESTFWNDVHNLVQKCAVQPYAYSKDGTVVHGRLKSICKELKAGQKSALFTLDSAGREKFHATMSDSQFSDGGDLNDIVIRNKKGAIVAQKTAVPAFGDPLLGLAGGNGKFRMELDLTLFK